MIHGITYTPRQAKWLDLDTEKTFAELLEWGFDVIRLGCYWNEIEKEKGVYDFTEIEKLLKQCEEKAQNVVLTVGMKAARWPEYYFPEWMEAPRPDTVEKEVLAFVDMCIKKLKKYACITHWQVENEPLDPSGPNHWQISDGLLEKEVTLVRSLDNRPIIINVWGNLLTKRDCFKKAENLADIVGINLYYKTPFWRRLYIGPRDSQFVLKREIKKCSKPVWITELQAEPWERSGKDFRSDSPESISPPLLRKNIEKAVTLGAEAILLWGCEYWVFQKKRGNREYEDIAKKLLSQNRVQD